MFTPAQLEALQAAIDVAFDGTPAEEVERLEMERQARAGFAKCREITDTPAPSSKRCRLITPSTKGPNILLAVKSVMAIDPAHKVVVQTEIDYLRLWTQVNRLEAQYKVMLIKLQAAQDEIDDLKHVPAEYKDAEPEVEALPPFPKAVPSAEQIEDAAYTRPLGAPPAFEAPYKDPKADGTYAPSLAEVVLAGPSFRLGTAFHKHLDACERCRTQPMNLCPVGAILLRKEAVGA